MTPSSFGSGFRPSNNYEYLKIRRLVEALLKDREADFADGIQVGVSLDVNGTISCSSDTSLGASLDVGGDVHVQGALYVQKNVDIYKNLTVNGETELKGVTVSHGLNVGGDTVLQSASVTNDLMIHGKLLANDLTIFGDIELLDNIIVGGVGQFGKSVTSPSFHTTSDRRLKNNVKYLNDGDYIAFFNNLKPCSYTYIDKPLETRFGFIAQDIRHSAEKFIKHDITLIGGSDDGALTLDLMQLIPLLVNRVQKLETVVQDMKGVLEKVVK